MIFLTMYFMRNLSHSILNKSCIRYRKIWQINRMVSNFLLKVLYPCQLFEGQFSSSRYIFNVMRCHNDNNMRAEHAKV